MASDSFHAPSRTETSQDSTPLRIDVLTIFPALVEACLGTGIPRIAADRGLVELHAVDLREFTTNRHRSVDDRPYGGGPGMLMRPEPICDAVDTLLGQNLLGQNASVGPQPAGDVRPILLSPQGEVFDQAMARELARAPRILLICGRYEGFDERIRPVLDCREVSLGDYVLSGGELAAAVIADAVIRLLPGALGHETSADSESFTDGLLDFPQFTRPPEFRGHAVPEVLLSGDHEAIARWRAEQSRRRTSERRPDLMPDGKTRTARELETTDSAPRGAPHTTPTTETHHGGTNHGQEDRAPQ